MRAAERVAHRDTMRLMLADIMRDAEMGAARRVDGGQYGKRRPIVYFVTRRVAQSGMSRVFSVYVGLPNGLRKLDNVLIGAFGYTRVADGFRIGGGGMDMRFAVCDDIARVCRLGSGNDIDYRSL